MGLQNTHHNKMIAKSENINETSNIVESVLFNFSRWLDLIEESES